MTMVDTIIAEVDISIDLKVTFTQAMESPIRLIVVNILTLSSIITGNFNLILINLKLFFRAVQEGPTQFKRVVPNQYYQQQQQYQQPQYSQQQNPQPNYPQNAPNQMNQGGNMPYNPYGGYNNPQPPGHNNRFGSLNQNLQNQSNPYDLLNKRDRPNQQVR